MSWDGLPFSQWRHEARLILFYKIINGLAEVPFEGRLNEVKKGTRTKQNKKSRQDWSFNYQYGHSFLTKLLVHGTSLLSLKLHHWKDLNIHF